MPSGASPPETSSSAARTLSACATQSFTPFPSTTPRPPAWPRAPVIGATAVANTRPSHSRLFIANSRLLKSGRRYSPLDIALRPEEFRTPPGGNQHDHQQACQQHLEGGARREV